MNIPVVTAATEFKTVSAREDSEFDKQINKYLREGWKLYGVPNHLMYSSGYVWQTQYLIKE